MRGREAVTERVAASQAKRDWSNVINRAFSGKVPVCGGEAWDPGGWDRFSG